MTDGLTASDVALIQGNGRNSDDMFGGNGAWWIVLFLIFGWGRNGYGGIGSDGGSSIKDQYVLSSDFATIQRQLSDGFSSIDNALDAQNTGICNLGYTQQTLANNISTNVMQGFNATQTQLADCCCKTQQNIKDTQYAIATTGAGIQNQLQTCCCDIERQIERGFADTNYAMASQNCATLQAIDKAGDRILDFLQTQETSRLRDENQALRLAASQQAQNSYIVNTLTAQIAPRPVPAFAVNPPYQYVGCNGGCGCNGIA